MNIPGIPQNILKPGFYGAYNTLGALGLGSYTQRLLLVGQQLSTGTQAAATPIQVFSANDAATLFGAGSQLHRMCLLAMAQDPGIAPWLVGMADAGAATASAGSVTFTGTASASGTLVVYAGYERLELGVQNGDLAATLAARLTSLVGAVTRLPVTAATASGACNLTAKNKGAQVGAIALNVAGAVAGITVAITAMTGGATDPDPQPALDAVTPSQFDVVAFGLSDATSLGKLKTYLDLVSSAVEERPGRGFAAVTGTAKAIAAQVTLAAGVNEERTHLCYLPGSWSAPWELAAAVAGLVEIAPDPAVPFDGRILVGIHAPDISLRLIRSEQETLLAGGVTPLEADNAGNVSVVRMVTTRTTTNGSTDLTLLDTNPIAILDYFRSQARTLIRVKYPGRKETDAVLNSIKADVYHLAKQLETAEILQHVDNYKDQFVIVRDPNYPGRALLQIPTPWVPGLHQALAQFNLITVT